MNCECTDKGFSSRLYNDKYDSYYCGTCLTWLSLNCGGEDCEYCSNRPEKCPEEVQFN